MNQDFEITGFARYALSGLLAGFMTALINFITYFSFPSISYSIGFINIVSLIYGSLVPATIGGVVYAFFKEIRLGSALYMIVFLALTILALRFSFYVHYWDNPAEERHFHMLFGSIIVNTGLFATLVVPALAVNKKLTDKFI
jgi:hypothetical protein